MNIVIIHHHLYPGGVTRIIESQLKTLDKLPHIENVKILTGACPNTFKNHNAEIIVEPLLNYIESRDFCREELHSQLHRLTDFLERSISADTDIIHIHNLNLGKNPIVTYAIYMLAEKGYRILNHCHDFAEDRPENRRLMEDILWKLNNKSIQTVLYPDINNYRFAMLNSYDCRRVQDEGINASKTFLLPNPVSFPNLGSLDKVECKAKICNELSLDQTKLLFIYPVRVIRRKNIGEFILLASLFSGKANWMVTMAPKNPVEIAEYTMWKEFCKQQQINVHFEVGEKCDFFELMTGADCCITTSIREGFGMAFLEPWLFNTPVIGRNIPSVTEDFIKQKLKFPLLYDSLMVSGKHPDTDFPELSISQRTSFIRNLMSSENLRSEFVRKNPQLKSILSPVQNGLVAHNIDIIRNNYSLDKYGELLNAIYKTFS